MLKRIIKAPVALSFMIVSFFALTGCTTNNEDVQVLNIYSSRHYETDAILFDKFTDETGIQVNVINAPSGDLVERLRIEGENTNADLIIAIDSTILTNARKQDLLQPIHSDILLANTMPSLRDEDNYWFPMSKRARGIAYSKERVNPEDIKTYNDIAAEDFYGRVLLRSGTNIYNQSLVASFIHIYGEEETFNWAQGVTNNMARPPQGNDTDQIIAIAAGEGDVALVHSYYLGLLLNSTNPEEALAAQSIGIMFPNQETTGTHINISGMAIPRHSTNKENALKFMEFISEYEQQSFITNNNFEYPINPNVSPSPLLISWGDFNTQKFDYYALSDNYIRAIQIINSVGWE